MILTFMKPGHPTTLSPRHCTPAVPFTSFRKKGKKQIPCIQGKTRSTSSLGKRGQNLIRDELFGNSGYKHTFDDPLSGNPKLNWKSFSPRYSSMGHCESIPAAEPPATVILD